MDDKATPPDAGVEPTREVLRQIYMGFGSMSFDHDSEAKLLYRAHQLADQGWLSVEQTYPCGGRNYTRFKAGLRLDLPALKHL